MAGMTAATVLASWRDEPASAAVGAALQTTGQRAWLVGGAVRDGLLGRPINDWDLLCAEAMPVAREVAARTGGRLVVLHEEPVTCRVVLQAGSPRARFLDLVAFRAGTLEEDLAARDFSINALAVELPAGPLTDPCQGLADLRHRLIRAISRGNLVSDPLRCLRAYRFHSELGFAIEARTRGYLRELAALLPRVAGERLGAELLKLLAPGRAAQTLALMAEDGLLWELLPELQATQGVTQGGYHHRDVWGHTLEVVANLERLLSAKEPPLPANAEAVASYLAAPERPVLLLLAALLHDVAKPACALDDGAGRTRFLGHEVEGGRVAAQVAGRLALRGDLREGLRGLVLGHMRPVLLANSGLAAADRPAQVISIGALRRLFRDAGPDGVGLVLLALADVQGCRGPATQPGYHQAVAGVLDAMLARYRAWQTETAEQPLLTGADLIAAGHAPSPAFGRALRAVDDARADGLVANAAEALAWAQRHLAGDGRGEGEGLPGSEEVF